MDRFALCTSCMRIYTFPWITIYRFKRYALVHHLMAKSLPYKEHKVVRSRLKHQWWRCVHFKNFSHIHNGCVLITCSSLADFIIQCEYISKFKRSCLIHKKCDANMNDHQKWDTTEVFVRIRRETANGRREQHIDVSPEQHMTKAKAKQLSISMFRPTSLYKGKTDGYMCQMYTVSLNNNTLEKRKCIYMLMYRPTVHCRSKMWI